MHGIAAGPARYEIDDPSMVLDIADVRAAPRFPPGPIALFDPIGGPIAVALAEELGDRAILITQDHIAGNELSRTGDLAPANVRLAQRGVHDRTTIIAALRPSRRGRGRGSLLGSSDGSSPAPPWSIAASVCRPTRSPSPICRRATALRRARSTRRCSKAVAWP